MRFAWLAVLLAIATTSACASTRHVYVSDDASENRRRGDDAFVHADYAKAATLYDAVIARDRRANAYDYVRRASIFMVTRDYAAGVRWIDTFALPRFPHHPSLLDQRAIMLFELGRREEARASAREALAQRPELCYARYVLDESHDALAACFQRGVDGDPATR
jgi:tetratricopeptide (TPR) repeat protein